jgi:formylmethanofuran dehydrogenase subunit E
VSDIDALINIAKDFHGGMCPGIVLGSRATAAALRELRMNAFEKNPALIVYVEIDRCMADAVQAITGCSLGHRTLKYLPYGKFAATFVHSGTGEAVRISIIRKPSSDQAHPDMKEIARTLSEAPEADLLRIERVEVIIPKEDLPGFPTHKETCKTCAEEILDRKETRIGDEPTCKNCANGSYYTILEA